MPEELLKIALREATQALSGIEESFVSLFSRADFSVELYAPKGVDPQQPHEQDEVYIVASGSGTFLRGRERVMFERGDMLFVPAGIVHRFERFSEDFSTWVIFFGPKGGCSGELKAVLSNAK